jgi:hypothetical protein
MPSFTCEIFSNMSFEKPQESKNIEKVNSSCGTIVIDVINVAA